MKKSKFIFQFSLFLLIISSCKHANTSLQRHANWEDSTFRSDTMVIDNSKKTNEYCFISIGGVQQRDSSYVNMVISGNKVVGKYSWVPFEKDNRTGPIEGTKNADTIDVIWHFTQEGIRDTLHTTFLLKGNTLKQKGFAVDAKTGRQVTDRRSKFSITYHKVACPSL